MPQPVNIQLIGPEIAIAWDDGMETYFLGEDLRAASPSAENIGERDILGNQYGGDGPKRFPGVTVLGWDAVAAVLTVAVAVIVGAVIYTVRRLRS